MGSDVIDISVNWNENVRKFWKIGPRSNFINFFNVIEHDLIEYSNIDIKNDVIIIPIHEILYDHIKFDEIILLLKQGIRFIIDGLWEKENISWVPILSEYQKNGLLIFGCQKYSVENWSQENIVWAPTFFWANEYHHNRNYSNNKIDIPHALRLDATHDFLMPVRVKKENRLLFFELLGERINRAMYSKVWENIFLPGETSITFDERAYNFNWYNHTYYSLVIETCQKLPIFITEKTFKPIMYGHPFMIFGAPSTLRYLRELGFKTFPELFDESYDDELDLKKRAKKIIDQIDNFKWQLGDHLQDILKKVIYNKDRFNDLTLIKDNLSNEIAIPVGKWLNEK